MMINLERIRERYLRDGLPVRLGGLAADLARIASSARYPGGSESVAMMLEECQYFIEWTAPALVQSDPDAAGELADIQLMLAMWRTVWPEAQHSASQKNLLSLQAKKWADQVLEFSGLLKEG